MGQGRKEHGRKKASTAPQLWLTNEGRTLRAHQESYCQGQNTFRGKPEKVKESENFSTGDKRKVKKQ